MLDGGPALWRSPSDWCIGFVSIEQCAPMTTEQILSKADHLARVSSLEEMRERSAVRGAQNRIFPHQATRNCLAPRRPQSFASKVVVRQRLEELRACTQ